MTCRGCPNCKPRDNWKKGQSKHYCTAQKLDKDKKYGYWDEATQQRYMEVSEKNLCHLGMRFRKYDQKDM